MSSILGWLRRGERSRRDRPHEESHADRPEKTADDSGLIGRTEEYNQRAERYWQELAREPAGREHVLNKPFGAVLETPTTLYRLGLVLAELHAGPGHTVLDFGAGSCWVSACLNRQGVSTIAVDVSPTALELGRELFSMDRRQRCDVSFQFLPYDGHHLPLPAESVDRVVCFDALHHVPNLDEMLAEIARVLRRGGRAVLAEPGKGHSHSESSLFDVERFEVLENELTAPDLERRALRAGFTNVRLKPYPDPSAISMDVGSYMRLAEGDAGAFPIADLSRNLQQVLIAILSKGDEIFDSRYPHLLRAEIRRAEGEGVVRCKAGTSLPVTLRIRNLGDTIWRHEMNAPAGHVLVSGHLLSDTGRMIAMGFFRLPLPRSVAPGETVDLVVDLPLPVLDLPRCRVRFDLVDERVTWFGPCGSETMDLAIELDDAADLHAPCGLSARITAALPSSGLSSPPMESCAFSVQIENTGRSAWANSPAPAPGTVSLGAHLTDSAGTVIDFDFFHLPLPQAVQAGGSFEMQCTFLAPSQPGSYRLRLDLVIEAICWFESRGSESLDILFAVKE